MTWLIAAPKIGPIRVPMPPKMVMIRALTVVTAEIIVGDALIFQIEYNDPAMPAKTEAIIKAIVRYVTGL